MTTTDQLLARADNPPTAHVMTVTGGELHSISDMAKCLVTVDDMLIVFCGYETCPHAGGCPTAFRCSEFEGCLGRVAQRCTDSKVQRDG